MKKTVGLGDITKKVNENFDDQIGFLTKLVRENSINITNGSRGNTEEGVARIIRGKLLEMGVGAKYVRARKHRPNVVAVWGPVRARRSMAMVGHLDTICPPWGNEKEWFSGEVEGKKLYGAGVLDMKASLAAYVFALKALVDLKQQPVGQLKLAFTVDGKKEDGSNLGLRFLVRKGFRATAGILGKPGVDKIGIGHRGGYRFKIVTRGMAVNTGRRVWEEGKKGKNAITDMARIIRKLSSFDLPYRPAKAFPGRLPVFTFPTKISGGRSVEMVPDYCEASGDVRLLPGNTDVQVKMWIEEKLSTLTDISWELFDELYAPAMEIDRNNKLVQIMAEQAAVTLGKKPRLEGVGPWNESWMLTCQADTPCITGFGPDGDDGLIEGGREWVDLDSLKKVTEVYARTIYQYLCSANMKEMMETEEETVELEDAIEVSDEEEVW